MDLTCDRDHFIFTRRAIQSNINQLQVTHSQGRFQICTLFSYFLCYMEVTWIRKRNNQNEMGKFQMGKFSYKANLG